MFEQRPVRRLFPILLLNLVAFAVAIPILPALAFDLGGDALDVGLLFGLQSLAQFAMAPVWGGLSDRFGRKPVLVVTLVGLGVFDIATAASSSLWMLYAARALTGAFAGNVATASALVADATPASDRSKGMAIVGISFGIGFTVGPALGAGLAALPEACPGFFWEGTGLWGTGLPFAFAGLMALGTALVASFILVEPATDVDTRRRQRSTGRFQILFDHPNARLLVVMCGLFFAYTAASAMLEVAFFPYANEIYGFDESEVGIIFAGMGLLLAAVQGTVGRISDRIGDRRMTGLGVLLMTVGLGVAPMYRTLGFLLVFVAVATIGRALVHPAILSLTSSLSTGPGETGKVMGVLQSSSSLGRIVGHVSGGMAFDLLATNAPFWVAAATIGLAGVGWWVSTDRGPLDERRERAAT
jgi:MFS family permease